MKKILIASAVAVILTGCGTTDPFTKRAEAERERQERSAQTAISNAPKWMTELPKSTSAVYENGTAVSSDMSMSVNKAKTLAFGKICMAAGGTVNQQSKIYRTDSESASTEFSELAIKSSCRGVDISGVEIMDTKMVQDGGRIRTYVLVALPTGDANAIVKARDARDQRRTAEIRSREAFKEMDQAESKARQ